MRAMEDSIGGVLGVGNFGRSGNDKYLDVGRTHHTTNRMKTRRFWKMNLPLVRYLFVLTNLRI